MFVLEIAGVAWWQGGPKNRGRVGVTRNPLAVLYYIFLAKIFLYFITVLSNGIQLFLEQ